MKNKRYEDYTREELELNYKIREYTKYSLIGILVLFIIITIFNSITTVKTGYVGVKTKFGKVQDTMIQEGINFKVPYIEKINLIDCRTQKFELSASSSSKDLQTVNVTVAINYTI